MSINIMQLIVIITLCGLAYWVNETLNKVPVMNTVIKVIIVVVGVLLVLQSCGLLASSTIHVGGTSR